MARAASSSTPQPSSVLPTTKLGRALRAAFAAIAAALETAIRRAQAADEARADLDPAAAAELVLAAVLGMRVRGRVDPDRAGSEELVGLIVASLT